ncbi:MAG: hypothetical protein KH972_05705 [Peptostreptococcaceae bacterium]|nr:hypothetical protein [uncultured Criibacterium sp.]MBS6063346.1 hypothetical protein [Peptostreptococcaceae bacterium]
MNYLNLAKSISQELKTLRAELHKYPEPSTKEVETSKIILTHLKKSVYKI